MMASDSAPAFLSPAEYGIVELHGLLIDFQVQAFTLSQPLRWAVGYYAVCSITGGVAPIGAIGIHLVRSQPPMATAAPRLDRPVA